MTNKEWFKSRKWGIFCHYINPLQNNNPIHLKSAKPTDWNTCVDAFNVEAFAKQLHEMGCGYLIFTMGQADKYWCAPNDMFSQITGYKTGEACSKRDLIADIIAELKKYDIPFFLYFTGDGPIRDKQAATRMGWFGDGRVAQLTDIFLERWIKVIEEYSLRYGTDIKGWWFDGCFDFLGYENKHLEILKKAALKGNPDALVAFNNGVDTMHYNDPKFARFVNEGDCPLIKMDKIHDALLTGLYDTEGYMESDINKLYRPADDYTAGEKTEFEFYPDGSEMPCVWHILAFLGLKAAQPPMRYPYENDGSGWARPGSRYSAQYMYDYVKAVNEKGGVVSIDVCLFRDGTIDLSQVEVLRLLKDLR